MMNKRIVKDRLEAMQGAINTARYLFLDSQREIVEDEETEELFNRINDKLIDLSSDITILSVIVG